MSTRLFEWFQLGVLVFLVCLGTVRVVWLRVHGVRTVVADWQRTGRQMLADTVLVACLLVWAYEIVAFAWPLRFHVGPAFLSQPLLDIFPVRLLGMAFDAAGLLIYSVALFRLGESWRLGLDRTRPGPLVTGGIYAKLRHPIYVAFDLLFIGTFLVLQRPIFLLLLMVMAPLLHTVMIREERFLSELYGDAYRDYCGHAGRYF